jgi:hypothetical protein
MYLIKQRLLNNGERVPKELAASLDQASHFCDRKVFFHAKILLLLSAHKGRQTIHESVCHKSPHTPGRFQVSVCAKPPQQLSREAIEEFKAIYQEEFGEILSDDEVQEIVAAEKRGVKVQVILDKSQRTEKYSEADFLIHEGVPTWIDAKHAIAHNKIMVIDDKTVLTGSFNFTKAAEENNAENLLVIQDVSLASKYTTNWQMHLTHSELYGGHNPK